LFENVVPLALKFFQSSGGGGALGGKMKRP